MATTASFPHRSIVIIGRKGAGKSTVGNSLSQTSEFPIGCVLSNKQSWTSHKSFIHNDTSFSFYMIEKLPSPALSPKSAFDNESDEVSFPKDISLVIFVFKYGCFTQEERDFFNTIIGNFNDKLRDISALVITGCDDLSEDAKKAYKKKFQDDTETDTIARVMGKGIYCVTLPDISKIRPNFLEVYEKDIEQSQEMMKDLLDSCVQTLPLDFLMKQQSTGSESIRQWILKLGCQIL